MRVVLTDWDTPSFEDLAATVEEHSSLHVVSVGDRRWAEFEAVNADGETVLAGAVWTGAKARDESDELAERIDRLEGSDDDRRAVLAQLRFAGAVVGMEILMSTYDDAVAAANMIIDFFAQYPGMLTQVDTVGWYDGPDLILKARD